MPDAGKTGTEEEDGTQAVRFQSVDKVYKLHGSPRDRLMESLGFHRWVPGLTRPEIVNFFALKDIDLRIGMGERVGIVGRNGAGKTTLLKLVTRNFKASSGTVSVNGSVQALMQMGLGFNPEFSGYDNIRASLDYNGLSGELLEDALADVVDFVELDEFLHQPMKTYSMGMRARLQFATATAIRPDIVIVDEMLGAGDAYFSAKSGRRMETLAGSGCTLMLVSHSIQQMLQFCDRVVWLHGGQIRMDGPALEVLTVYESYLEQECERIYESHGVAEATENGEDPGETSATPDDKDTLVSLEDGRIVHRWPSNRGIKTVRLALLAEGKPAERLEPGQPAEIEIEIIAEEPGEYGLRYILTFWRSDGVRIARLENQVDRFHLEEGERRNVKVVCANMLLGPGKYDVTLAIYDILRHPSTVGGRVCRFDVLSKALPLEVVARRDGQSPACRFDGDWSFLALKNFAET